MTNDKESRGVTIDNISGGIHNSIIAGRDVKKASIAVGGQPVPTDEKPTIDALKQLLMEIQKELAEITVQSGTLKAISPASLRNAQGAEDNIKEVAEKIASDIKPEDAQSVQEYLNEAATSLGGVLDKARAVPRKPDEGGSSVEPIVKKLEPLVEKIRVAASWVGKLWFPA